MRFCFWREQCYFFHIVASCRPYVTQEILVETLLYFQHVHCASAFIFPKKWAERLASKVNAV